MKAKQVAQPGIFLLLAISIFSSFGFSYKKKNNNNTGDDYLILVAVAYGKKKCGSSTFSNAVGYDKISYSYKVNFSNVQNDLKKKAASIYNVPENDIYIESGYKSVAVVISYKKEISGWNCSVTKYAIGFGSSRSEAEKNAVSKKNNDSPSSSHTIEETIII